MTEIRLLEALTKDGVAKLMDRSAYRLAPDELELAAEWHPGTEIVIKENSDDPSWPYKLMSSGGCIPVKAAPHNASL